MGLIDVGVSVPIDSVPTVAVFDVVDGVSISVDMCSSVLPTMLQTKKTKGL